MKAKEEEDQIEQEKLVARVKQLEHSLEDCTEKLVYWQGKYSEMEDVYGRERQLRQSMEMEIGMLRKGMTNGMEAVALPPRRPVQNEYMAEPAPGASDATAGTDLGDMGCGKCCVETRCACIEEAFKMDDVASEPDAPTFKRPHSPQSHTDSKRHRLSNPDTGSEIDFTAQFSTRRPSTLTSSASTSSSVAATAPPDPCGFCSDGTACLCAELAKERPDRSLKPPASTLPTPPESALTDTSTSNPCVNGPGTCTQCRSNPVSTLFCKSLAATRSLSSYPLPSTTKSVADQATNQETTLNCADTFTVLSRHPGFDQATSELNTWLPHLSTVPSATTAFDIEAASVMGVLRLFDRRFGKKDNSAPTTPREAPSDEHDGLSTQVLMSGERNVAFEDTTQTTDGRGRNQAGKHASNDGSWIAYAPGSQAKWRPGRPRIEDGRKSDDVRQCQDG